MGAAETARLIAGLELDDRKFQRGVNSSLRGTKRMEEGFGKLGHAASKIGTRLAIGVGVALAGSAKAAIDWQDAFQGVVKTVDEADLKSAGLTFDKLGQSLREMSTEMPISAIDLAHIAESAGALGIKAKDIEAFTRQVAILSTTTNISADDAATALGQLTGQIGLTGDEFDNFAAALVDLGNKGSSTESQILDVEKRAGGFAKTAGLAKDAALGWAAATANIFGDRTEMGGTALGKFFRTALTAIGGGGKKLQAFAKIAGVNAKAFQKQFGKDASGALQKFIRGLSKLKGAERITAIEKIFGKGAGTTKLINDLANGIDKNLNPALEDSKKAWFESAAAQAEFDKRNATVKSSLIRLKNGIIDAAVSVGEGFTPALGRASDKLAAFLKTPANRDRLKQIGRDIGEAIDKIDWSKLTGAAESVAAGLKPALDLLLRIAEAVSKLPPEVLGAGGAFVIGNKLSGGLLGGAVGDIFGGLGESLAKSLASKIPIFGKAFVQPVFVTNQGFGLPGGVPGGAPGGLTGAVLGGTAGAGAFIPDLPEHNRIVADVVAKNFTVSDPTFLHNLRDQQDDTPWDKILVALGLKQPKAGVEAVRDGERERGGPGSTLVVSSVKDMKGRLADLLSKLHAAKEHGDDRRAARLTNRVDALKEKIALAAKAGRPPKMAEKPRPPALVRDSERERPAGEKVTPVNLGQAVAAKLGPGIHATTAKVEAAKQAQVAAINATGSRTGAGIHGTTSAVQSASSAITGAIHSSRPIITTNVDVNVSATTVEKTTTTSTRYGGGNGSYGGRGSNNDRGKG